MSKTIRAIAIATLFTTISTASDARNNQSSLANHFSQNNDEYKMLQLECKTLTNTIEEHYRALEHFYKKKPQIDAAMKRAAQSESNLSTIIENLPPEEKADYENRMEDIKARIEELQAEYAKNEAIKEQALQDLEMLDTPRQILQNQFPDQPEAFCSQNYLDHIAKAPKPLAI